MHEVIQMYKIKELAELYGIHTNVLRFYEKKGLLASRRLTNGYRERMSGLYCRKFCCIAQ